MAKETTVTVTEAVSLKLATALINQTGEVNDILPDDMSAPKVHATLVSCIGLLDGLNRRAVKTKLYIGRLLQLATNNPEVYTGLNLGLKGFEDYLKYLKNKYFLSRTNLYDSRTLVEAWSSLAVEKVESLGITKLMDAAKYTNQDDPGHKKVLAMAEKAKTAEQFKDQLEQLYSAPGNTTGASLRITGTKADIKLLETLDADQDIAAYVGSNKLIKKILAAFAELSAEVSKSSGDKGKAA